MAAAPDTAHTVLSDPRAPADERHDAQAEMHRQYHPVWSQLVPDEKIMPAIRAIQEGLAQEAMMAKAQIIQFPGRLKPTPTEGMRSVRVDEFSSQVSGGYFEKTGSMTFDSLRRMVTGTPLLNSIILTRIRQVQRFSTVSEDGGLGFAIRHRDKAHKPSKDEQKRMQEVERFISNCGWEWKPRERKRMRRDPFSGFLAKHTRDTLTFDSAPIETEQKRDKNLGMDGFYAVDGSTVRLCTEDGWEGDPDAYAIQLVGGRVATVYTLDDLIYEVRNPQTDVSLGGYGLGETELLVRVITYLLNSMTYNADFFDKSSIPKGILQLTGDYSDEDMAAFKRHWNAMVRGAEQKWNLPVMVSKDTDGKASYTPFTNGNEEMAYARWMVLLTSIACSIYGMDPAEISFESFSAGKAPLSGSDTEQKLAASQDKGLRPLLSHIESEISDYIVADLNEDWCFRFMGLDAEDAEKVWEGKKLTLTVDELRAQQGDGPHPDRTLGTAPLNPALIPAWQQLSMPQQQPPGEGDYGGGPMQPEEEDEDGFGSEEPDDGSPPPPAGPQPGGGGDPDGQDGQGQDGGQPGGDQPPRQEPNGYGGAGDPEDFGKALSLSAIYSLGNLGGRE